MPALIRGLRRCSGLQSRCSTMAAHPPGAIGHHAAVAGGVVQPGREQGHAGATAAVLLQQRLQGLGPQQGHIAVQHQQLAAEALQGLQQLLHRMARAVLGLLQHELEALQRRQGCLHPLGLVTHDQQLPFGVQVPAAAQHPLHQRGPGQRLQHLGQLALHPCALPSGQHGNGEHGRRGRLAGIYVAPTTPLRCGWSRPQRRRQAPVLLRPAPGLGLEPAGLDLRGAGPSGGVAVGLACPGEQVLLLHGREGAQLGAGGQGPGACRRTPTPAGPSARGPSGGLDRSELKAGAPQAAPDGGRRAVGEQPAAGGQQPGQPPQEVLAPELGAAPRREGVEQHQITAAPQPGLQARQLLAGLAPENPPGPAGLHQQQLAQPLQGRGPPLGAVARIGQGQLQGPAVQFQPPPAQRQAPLGCGFQQNGAVVAQAHAHIQHPQLGAGCVALQFGRPQVGVVCLPAGARRAVEALVERTAVQAEAAVGRPPRG